jgi:hypothetical protein
VRPFLIALALALVWFVQFQAGEAATGAPVWGVALVMAGRFFADLVGAWAAISLLRLALALGRLAVAYLRARALRA